MFACIITPENFQFHFVELTLGVNIDFLTANSSAPDNLMDVLIDLTRDLGNF